MQNRSTRANPMSAPSTETVLRELSTFTDELEAALLDRVWRQWALVGAGAAAARPDGSVAPIDPEALLLASLGLLDAEPRLVDVIHGWIRANARLISVQRLRNLAPHYATLTTTDGAARLAWLAQVARVEAKDARWRSLSGRSTAVPAALRPRGKSAPPPLEPRGGHQLVLRMRLGFGVGIKADVLSVLLSPPDDWMTIRELADALTYTPAPVRRALDDLTASAFVDRDTARPVRYRVDPARWRPLLGEDAAAAPWVSWDARYRFVVDWGTWARSDRGPKQSAYAVVVAAREVLQRHGRTLGLSQRAVQGAEVERTLAAIEALMRTQIEGLRGSLA